jgi:hypothetical protein
MTWQYEEYPNITAMSKIEGVRSMSQVIGRMRPIDVKSEATMMLAELSDARQDKRNFECFANFAATTRRKNTKEWMQLLVDWLNGLKLGLDPEARFELHQDHIILRRGVEEGEL